MVGRLTRPSRNGKKELVEIFKDRFTRFMQLSIAKPADVSRARSGTANVFFSCCIKILWR